MRELLLASLLVMSATGTAEAQFLENFDRPGFRFDPSGVDGWSFFSGAGEATIDFRVMDDGFASMLVDATHDRRNVWWALIKHRVSENMNLEMLARPGWELRVETRIRSSHAPRRVNLHVNTQRTTDFHSHLMEFDIAEAERWYTISMTTRDFPAEPGDTVFAQMALMDWGHGRYRIDVDYFKVDVVEAARARPDLGEPLPYHPPVPDVGVFERTIAAAESAVIDFANPDTNLGEWSVLESGQRRRVLTVSPTTWVILRWDLDSLRSRRVAGAGLLELTTRSVERNAEETKDFGLVRVVEILDGDPEWHRETVTADSLLRGEAVEKVFNPQMIIDWPVTEGEGAKTWLTIPRPVLQRLVDGRTRGLAVTPLGSIVASFSSRETEVPRLLVNLETR